jgi:hypothetical protein
MTDQLKQILDRLDALERRVDGLDDRTVGQIRLGPTKHDEAETAKRQSEAIQKIVEKIAPPVDHSQVCLTDGEPVTEDHRELKANGQQKGYVVLTEAERKKGFVRPVRNTYQHVGMAAPDHKLRDLTDEEQERYRKFGYLKFEEYPESESHVTGKYWTQAELDKVDKGCGSITTMGYALAETYARDPTFYGGTFCVGCGKHFPVDEFVWDGTNERVGS